MKNPNKIREDSIDESESPLPFKRFSMNAAILSNVHAGVESSNRETETTRNLVSRRVSANSAIQGDTGNTSNNVEFPLGAALLLRKAGRCTHPSCAADRARGIELARAAGIHVPNSLPAPIPSIAIERRYYPEDPKTGKQNRKNPQTYKELRPADPNDPEWKAAKDELDTGKNNLYFPDDLLAHHHDD